MQWSRSFSWIRWTLRSLKWRWHQSAATALAVAVAVAALAGALVVGWSLQRSLDTELQRRLGGIRFAVTPNSGYTPQFPERVQKLLRQPIGSFLSVAAVAATDSGLAVPATAWAAGHGLIPNGWALPTDIGKDEAILNAALARDLGASVGDWVVIRLDLAAAKPAQGLFTYRDPADLTRTLRLRVRQVVPSGTWADFSMVPTQRMPRNVFLSFDSVPSGTRPNCLLFPADLHMQSIAPSLNRSAQMEDLGYELQDRFLHSREVVIPKSQAEVLGLSAGAGAVCTNIAEEITSAHGRVSYGVLAASYGSESPADGEVVLNQWVAEDLGVAAGDKVTLEAMIVQRDGSYGRQELPLTVAAIQAVGTDLFDKRVTPRVEGLTDAARMDAWKTPFPIDLKTVTRRDEQYWEKYRATPKAVVSWNVMQELWRRSGFDGVAVTAMRLPKSDRFMQRMSALGGWLPAADTSWRVHDLPTQMEGAAVGSADFQALFLAMSFFLITAAVIIALGVIATSIDARRTEMDTAQAIGVADSRWRSMLLWEQGVACVPGVALGLVAGIVYARGLMSLFAWLSQDVWELPPIAADVRVVPLLIAGVAVATLVLGAAWIQLQRQTPAPAAEALTGTSDGTSPLSRKPGRTTSVICALLLMALATLILARAGVITAMAGFLAAAAGVLVAGWWGASTWLRPTASRLRQISIIGLCAQLARWHRRRMLLGYIVFAAASFVVCSVAMFRSGDSAIDSADRSGPTGGLALRISSPLAYRSDLSVASGRERFGLPADLPDGVQVYSLQCSRGAVGGCRNLAVPGEMQILGVSEDWIGRGGFEVITGHAQSNGWEVLETADSRDAIPVLGDEETMQWIAHRSLGEVFSMTVNGRLVQLRLVGLVRGGLFSGQLLMMADQLRNLLGTDAAYGYHFVQMEKGTEKEVAKMFAPLQEYGFTIEQTPRIIEGVRSVQELYMTLFMVLGGLGLLLGIGGSVVVLVRDALHRRAELALLQAAGLGRRQATVVLLVGHLAPLIGGVAVGAGAAVLGYLALGRPVHLLWPAVVCAVIVVVAGLLLAAVARLMQPRSLAAAMHVG